MPRLQPLHALVASGVHPGTDPRAIGDLPGYSIALLQCWPVLFALPPHARTSKRLCSFGMLGPAALDEDEDDDADTTDGEHGLVSDEDTRL